jgi:hypothetical protein
VSCGKFTEGYFDILYGLGCAVRQNWVTRVGGVYLVDNVSRGHDVHLKGLMWFWRRFRSRLGQ